MTETSASLLDRLRIQPDEQAWQRLNDLYTPLIQGWLRRQAVLGADNDDLVQEVLIVVMRKLPQFEHNRRRGAFRSWLRTITVNCLRDFWRTQRLRPLATGDSRFLEVLARLEDPNSQDSRQWDHEHDRLVTKRLLQLLESQFEPTTWKAFFMVTLEEKSPKDVAAELGISLSSVYVAKSRVLAKLRQESDGLVD